MPFLLPIAHKREVNSIGKGKGRVRIGCITAFSWFEGPNPALWLRILNVTVFFYGVFLELIKKYKVKNLDKRKSGISPFLCQKMLNSPLKIFFSCLWEKKYLQVAVSTGETRREKAEDQSVMLHFLRFCQLPQQPLNIWLWAMQCSQSLGLLSFPAPNPSPGLLGPAKSNSGHGHPAGKFSLAVKAHGKHGAVLQGSLGLDKVRNIHLNSPSMWAIFLLVKAGKFEGPVSDPTAAPSNLSKWFMCHCLCPFFLFLKSVPLLHLPSLSLWLLSWVAAPLMTAGLFSAQRVEDWQGMRRDRDVLCCCCQQSSPCFLLTLPYHCHFYSSRPCPENPLQWNDCQGAEIICRLSLTSWGSCDPSFTLCDGHRVPVKALPHAWCWSWGLSCS